MGSNIKVHKNTSQLHSKAMVAFKGGWSKFFFLRNKHTHIGERESGFNTKAHHNFTQKVW